MKRKYQSLMTCTNGSPRLMEFSVNRTAHNFVYNVR
jgi:hypothetical protein